MLMASTAALPATIPSVSGVTTPTIHPNQAALVAAAAVSANDNHNQKDTTYTKIFVGGLPYHTSDKSLREHFEVYGEIEEAVVITDRQTGKSRGYGFVTMADRSGAERAIKDPNPVIDGRKANVNLAYIGAKPRGAPASSFASLTPAGMRMYATHLGAAGAQFKQLRRRGQAETTVPQCLKIGNMNICGGGQEHKSYTSPTSYVYQLPYPTPTHIPILPTQTPHLNPAAIAATAGYTPNEYTAGAAAYTAAAYPAAPAAVDHFGMPTISPAALSGYNYALTHAAAASVGNTFSLGTAYPGAAAAAPAPQPATLQEARMQ